MSILAVETTGRAASAAFAADRKAEIIEKADESGGSGMNHLQHLMPIVSELLREQGADRNDIDCVAVSAGPGSFTGIRIGMAAAKTLAQVLGADIVEVMTLESFIYDEYGKEGSYLLCPMMDARRHTVYAAAWLMPEKKKVIIEGDYEVSKFAEMAYEAGKSAAGDGSADSLPQVYTGDGAEKYAEDLSSGDIIENTQHAAAVLRAALDGGRRISYKEAEPVYLKKAEAEIKRKEGKLGLRKRKKKEEGPELKMPPADGRIEYRDLSVSDTAGLADLDRICFKHFWSEDSFKGDFEGQRAAVYRGAFNSRGELVGFAGLVHIAGEAEVNRVAVHPLYRNKGIAGRCLKDILDQAGQAGVETTLLEVREANRSAISLYKNSGFRVISKRKNYYKETGENALIMKLGEEEKKDEGR